LSAILWRYQRTDFSILKTGAEDSKKTLLISIFIALIASLRDQIVKNTEKHR
jgi:hypothetical protein